MHRSRRLPDLAPNALAAARQRLRAAGTPVIDLTESNPTRCGFAYPGEAIRAALAHPAVLAYGPDARGAQAAREAVAAHHGHGLSAEDLLLTASTSEAYALLFKALGDPGDEVLVPSPSYPLFEWLARLEGLEARPVPSYFHEGWHLDLEALATAGGPRTRAVVVVNPNNPTGHHLRRTEWTGLLELCARRGWALVVDEVFADYPLEPAPDRLATALSEAAPPCPLFVLSGLSKVAALPQVKLGWLAARGPGARGALEDLAFLADQYLSVSASAQAAAPALLALAPALQAQVTDRLRTNLAALDAALADPAHLARLRVEGGWSALLRVPALEPDQELALRLLERDRVLVHPGSFFDLPGDGHLVLSLLPPPASFAAGVQALTRALAGSS